MGSGDFHPLKYDEICDLCSIYSRGNVNLGMNSRDATSRFVKIIVGAGVTWDGIDNIFEKILNSHY